MTVLVICGLRQEASLAAGSGITVVAGGGNRDRLETLLAGLSRVPFEAVVSFGLAGALDATLSAGDLVLPRTVMRQDGPPLPTDPTLRARWSERLGADAAFREHATTLIAVDRPIVLAAEKRGLSAQADAVDMESEVAGLEAARRDVPFGVLRAISDEAQADMPRLVATAMKPNGSIAVGRVLIGLARRPTELPALLRTARDAGRAMRTLGRVRSLLGPRLGFDL